MTIAWSSTTVNSHPRKTLFPLHGISARARVIYRSAYLLCRNIATIVYRCKPRRLWYFGGAPSGVPPFASFWSTGPGRAREWVGRWPLLSSPVPPGWLPRRLPTCRLANPFSGLPSMGCTGYSYCRGDAFQLQSLPGQFWQLSGCRC